MRVSQRLLLYAVATVPADVDQSERRHALGQPVNAGVGVALLLGKERRAVRNDQPHVAHAGLVDARVIDLVEDAVAEREPDVTVGAERRAHADLGARGPSRCDAGRPWSETRRLIWYNHGHDSPGAIEGNQHRLTVVPQQGNVGALPRIGMPSVGR